MISLSDWCPATPSSASGFVPVGQGKSGLPLTLVWIVSCTSLPHAPLSTPAEPNTSTLVAASPVHRHADVEADDA